MSTEIRHDRAWWVATVAAQRNSLLNEREFALSVGVVPDTFRWWRRKLDREPAAPLQPVSSMVRVEVGAVQDARAVAPSPPRLLEAGVCGVAIRFEVGTDVTYMAELLGTIARSVQAC